MSIDLIFNHDIPIHELSKWIDTTIHFSVGNLSYMYPKPIEIFIKWTIFLGILTLIGQIIFASFLVVIKSLEVVLKGRDLVVLNMMNEVFSGAYIVCFVGYIILFFFNFINGSAIG